MKIHEVQIEHIRGIKDRISLSFNGKNSVIFGPNGTGKSGIVDAIDFLFTGNISRLTGRGSRGMSQDEHGPHIDAKPEDAIVRAQVSFDGKDPIILERKMSDPKKLLCTGDMDDSAKAALQVAAKGQHVLSRSEILKFIESESGQRSAEIQALLNLNKVEELRKAFVTISRDAERKLQADRATFTTSKTKVKDILDLKEFSEAEALKKVNEHRKALKGTEIDSLDLEKLKEGISPRSQESKDRVSPEQLKTTLSAVNELIEDKGEAMFKDENDLRGTVKQIKEDAKLKRDLQNKRLLDLGISLIDESGCCPLCLTTFNPGELEGLLNARLKSAKQAEAIETNIRTLSSRINTEVSALKAHIELLSASAKKLKLDDVDKELSEWTNVLSDWSSALSKATEDYPINDAPEIVRTCFAYDKWPEHNKKLSEATDGIKKSSPEQEAWDALTALYPVLERYFEDKKKYEDSDKFSGIARIMNENYTKTKDNILEKLYNSVNDDFTKYYKYLHEDDEGNFASELKPDGPQLDFKVDFYGRGKHHPRALHSEGHQDSMGLCLFLALNQKISEEKVGFVILDDVVMSIDSEHRRNVCKLLKEKFSDMQFVITTHNTTWARQLKSDGVVTEKNMVRFTGWSVDGGPKMKTEAGDWAEIENFIKDGNISAAAWKLREYLEFVFEMVSDSLKANVPYSSDSRYELGDYIISCKERFTSLLSQAKRSANSWNKKDDMARLEELETQTKEIITRSQSEQWGINDAVHYNKWQDFTKDDFLPIFEAFRDFEGLFKCATCGGLIAVAPKARNPVLMKCPCGAMNWNLEENKKVIGVRP
jgi:DNA repair exonuclease SbcCD ATPase subunit